MWHAYIVTFCDSMLNSGRIIRLFGQTRFMHFCAYFIAFCSRPEAVSGVISGKFMVPIVRDKPFKFFDPCLNCSQEIPPEAIEGVIFDSLYAITFDQM